MKTRGISGLLIFSILMTLPSALLADDELKLTAREEMSFSRESIGRRIRDMLERWKENFSFEIAGHERPLISLMLLQRERLGLSAEQVRNLEQLRNDFTKESIRSDANLRIAEMDLDSLLEAQPVDITKVEAKVREIEGIRGDLRIARIRAIEKAKAQLNAEQHRKLQELQAGQNFTWLAPEKES
jgi:hypothetical protein